MDEARERSRRVFPHAATEIGSQMGGAALSESLGQQTFVTVLACWRRLNKVSGTNGSWTLRWREMDSNFQYAGAVNLFVAPTTMSPSNKGRSVGSVANKRSYLT